MIQFILRRLLAAVPVLLLVSLISASIMHLVPGDAATVIAGQNASDAEIAQLREQLGLNRPFPVKLAHWYADLARGDLGNSILLNRPVTQAIAERVPVTLALAGFALLLTVAIGVPCGIIAAIRANTWVDQAVLTLALVGVSVPNFWLSLMLIVLFGVMLDWLPAGGYVPFADNPAEWVRSLILPGISLALLQIGLLARITRATVLEVLQQDYIRTARAKGLPRLMVIGKHVLKNVLVPVVTVVGISFGLLARITRATVLEVLQQDYIRTARAKGLPRLMVIGKHVLKNVLVPVVTVVGISFGLLLSGSVVIETVYSIPGMGRLLANAIFGRDYPLIQGGLLITAAVLVLLNLVVDVLYAVIDPRIQYDQR